MKNKREKIYYRTAALLNAQSQVYARPRHRGRALDIPWRLITLLLLIGGITMWLLLDERWYLMGNDMHIVGTRSPQIARDVAIASDLLGWHGLRLRPRAAEALIVAQVPTITKAQVSCSRFPATCTLTVTERTPVLNWVTGNEVYWLDGEGLYFPAHEVQSGLPIVRGPLPATEKPYAFVQVLQGVKALAALGVETEQLEYHPQRGLIWTDAQGRRVAFGVGADMQTRWQIYNALIAHLDTRNIFPWAIDVRFPQSPTYSLERLW